MRLKQEKVVVCGGGGFIGGHLVRHLLNQGIDVIRAVDAKPRDEWYQQSRGVENLVLDLKEKQACTLAVSDADVIFNLAADMGGMGFIENNKGLCMLSVLINTHFLLASREANIKRFFFSSSACVYNGDRQKNPQVIPLKEEDAYPALPEDGYGWEKLFSERMCRHFEEDFGLQCRVARYHNVYGPLGTYTGGREKAPAAICRVKLKRSYNLDAPKGVNGRNSDNSKIHEYLGWEPSIRLRDGMAKTYEWIESEMLAPVKGLAYLAAANVYSS